MAMDYEKSTKMTAGDRKYQTECDLRVLRNYREIMDDKTRYRAAMKMANAQIAELKKIGGKGSDHG